jgi:pSer/pThr/pTyr-binding forkhead associated (FHA) protein
MILRIEQGPDAGQRWTINGPDATIGRDDGCDVSIQDERVSGRHARLWLEGDVWWVQDLNSTNRRWVNAKRLQGPSRLQTGDQLHLGLTLFSMALESLPTSPRTGFGD